MSSSVQPGPASEPKGEREKKGLGKVFSRVKTVLRGDPSSSSKRRSVQPTSGSAARATKTPATDKPAPEKSDVPTKLSAAAQRRAQLERLEGVTVVSKSKLFEERVKKLSERYGVEIDPSYWQQIPDRGDDSVLRMDKPIRIRVRRICHSCGTSFGGAKECPQCKHVRCGQCARYPAKRTEAEAIASRERRAAILQAHKENAPIMVDWRMDADKDVVLKRPSKTGGQDLIHRKPRQRVRRTCHECSTLFVKSSKSCEECGHARCTDCPRQPSKKVKYPLGYPGDEFGPNSVPHYECHNCNTLYPTSAPHGTACKECGQEKSDESPRARPRKVEAELDPDVLKMLQKRIEELKVT